MLGKILIPRVSCTMVYISTEMEEQFREESFRLKRVKEAMARKNKKKEKKDGGQSTSPCPCILEEDGDKIETIKHVCSSQNLSKTMVIDVPVTKPCGIGDEKQDLEGLLTQVDNYVKTLTERIEKTESTEKFVEEFNKFKGTINRYTTSVPPKPKSSITSAASVCAPKETLDSNQCSCHIIRDTVSENPSSGVCPSQEPRKAVSESEVQSKTNLRLEEGKTKGGKELLCPICYKIIADKIASIKKSSGETPCKTCKNSEKTSETKKSKSCSAIAKESGEETNVPCQICSERKISKKESPDNWEGQRKKAADKNEECSSCKMKESGKDSELPCPNVDCTLCKMKESRKIILKSPCPICSEEKPGKEQRKQSADKNEECSSCKMKESGKDPESPCPNVDCTLCRMKASRKNIKSPCPICAQGKTGKKASSVKSDYHKRWIGDEQQDKSPESNVCSSCKMKSEKESVKNVKSLCPLCSQRKSGKESSPVKSDYHKRCFGDEQQDNQLENKVDCSLCKMKSQKESGKSGKSSCPTCSQPKPEKDASSVKSDYHKRCLEDTHREKSPENVCNVCKKRIEKRESTNSPCTICGKKSGATDARRRDTFTSTSDLDVIPKKSGMPIKIIAKSSSSRESVSASSECLTCNYSSKTKSLYTSDTSTSVCTRCREGDTKESDKRRMSEPNICPKCQMIRERKSMPDAGKCPYCERKKEVATTKATNKPVCPSCLTTNKPVCPTCLNSESNESSMSEYQGGVSLSPEKSKCTLCRNDAKDQTSESSSPGITGSILAYLKSKFYDEKEDEHEQCHPGCILCKRPISGSSGSMRTLKGMRSSYPSSTKSRGIETHSSPECRSCMPPADSDHSYSESDEGCCGTQTSKSKHSSKHSCRFSDKVTQIEDTVRCVGEARKPSGSRSKNTREIGVVTKMADRYDVRPVHMLANAVVQVRCVCKPQHPSKVCYCVSEPVVSRRSGPVRRTRSYNL